MMGIDFTGTACPAGLQMMRSAAKAMPFSCACKWLPHQQDKKA